MDIYAHSFEKQKKDVANKLEEFFPNKHKVLENESRENRESRRGNPISSLF